METQTAVQVPGFRKIRPRSDTSLIRHKRGQRSRAYRLTEREQQHPIGTRFGARKSRGRVFGSTVTPASSLASRAAPCCHVSYSSTNPPTSASLLAAVQSHAAPPTDPSVPCAKPAKAEAPPESDLHTSLPRSLGFDTCADSGAVAKTRCRSRNKRVSGIPHIASCSQP